MKPHVLMTRRWPQPVIDRLAADYALTVDPLDRPLTPAEIGEAMGEFDAICPTVTDRIDATIIERPGTRVRILANVGAGFEHIDVAAAERAGIVVTNTPDVLTDATAELAILLMLMASRRAGEAERQLRALEWQGWSPTHMLGSALSGKLLGLVGFGRIAQATARMAQNAFGMRIACHSRRPPAPVPGLQGLGYFAELDALLAEADVVSLHCPGGAETYHLIDAKRLALMKSSAIIVNTARGTVIDSAALADALSQGRIAAAGLDVYEGEPTVPPALLALENAVLLPHLGSATSETRIAMGMRAVDNLDRFFAGEAPRDRVA